MERGRPFLSITALPFACKYDIISVMGLRLMADNGNLLQSSSELEELEPEGATGVGFAGAVEVEDCDLRSVDADAKKALSRDVDDCSA